MKLVKAKEYDDMKYTFLEQVGHAGFTVDTLVDSNGRKYFKEYDCPNGDALFEVGELFEKLVGSEVEVTELGLKTKISKTVTLMRVECWNTIDPERVVTYTLYPSPLNGNPL